MTNKIEIETWRQLASFYTCDSSFGELINLLKTMTEYFSQHPELDGNIETIKVEYSSSYWAGGFSLFDFGPLTEEVTAPAPDPANRPAF